MAKSPKKSQKSDRKSPGVSVAADSTGDQNFDLVDGQDIDDFRDLFGDGTEDITVHLYRLEPRFYKGERCDGFLGALESGDDLDYIRKTYGGGRYALRKRVGTKFRAQRHIRIGGKPKLESPSPAEAETSAPFDKPEAGPEEPTRNGVTRAPEREQLTPEHEPLARVNVAGVDIPLTGDMAKIKETMLFVRMLKTAFPEPPDINETLLKMAIEGRRDPDVLDQVEKLTAVFDRLKSISPDGGGSGSTNWLDIGSQVINAFVRYVETAGAKRSIGAIPQVAKKNEISAPAVSIPALPAVEPVETSGKSPLIAEKESDFMTYQEIAEKAGSYIVQGYISEPQQAPAETARVLDAVASVSEAERPELIAYKDVLYLVAKNILTSQVETPPEDIEKFRLYFNNVFDIFVSTKNLKSERTGKNESKKSPNN